MVNNYLPTYFNGYSGIADINVSSSNLRDVTLSVTGANATIKINSVTPKLAGGSWTGQYYSSVPITVTASAPPSGYEFDGWTISNCTIDNPSALTITVTLTGNAHITAKYKAAGITITPVTGVTLNKNTLSLNIGETDTIIATVTPSNATYKDVIWTSNNSTIATVNGGVVTAKNIGSATITASTVEGITKICTVTVNAFDLAAKLQTLSAQAIINQSQFNAAFSTLPIGSTHFSPGANLSITSDRKLKIEFFSNNGGGLDIRAGGGGINFKAGDVIEIKGIFTQIESVGLILNTLTTTDPYWRPLNNIYFNNGSFTETFTLTQSEADDINNNGCIRICFGGISPYDGTIYPAGTATLVIEQFKIYRN